jgi:hypothetical protein
MERGQRRPTGIRQIATIAKPSPGFVVRGELFG